MKDEELKQLDKWICVNGRKPDWRKSKMSESELESKAKKLYRDFTSYRQKLGDGTPSKWHELTIEQQRSWKRFIEFQIHNHLSKGT